MKIRHKVKSLIQEYKTNNPFELIEHLDISLVIYPMASNINGYYVEQFDVQSICINSELNDDERTIVAAHELGHAVLHKNQNSLFISNKTFFSQSKFEKQADIFAAELLLDDSVFSQYHGYSLEYISKCECVSSKLVEYKLDNLINRI